MSMEIIRLQQTILSELSKVGFNVSSNGRDLGTWLPKMAHAIASAVITEIHEHSIVYTRWETDIPKDIEPMVMIQTPGIIVGTVR